MDSLSHLPDEDRHRVINAHEFEKSFRAHRSVLEDPFYTVSEGTETSEPGTLLKAEEESDGSLYTLPPNLALSRFIYQSKTSDGTLVPVSAYVLWPYVARPYSNGLPMVVWAHGTSGVFEESAPSNNKFLWHHFQLPFQIALRGYVVVATDYAGLGVGINGNQKPIVHEYLNGPAQANDIFYSIIAARQAFGRLSRAFVAVGTSQGGMAAWAFAQKLVAEPLEGHLGTVILHPVTRLLDLPLDSWIMPLLLIMLAPSLMANIPSFKLQDIFTAKGINNIEILRRLKGSNPLLFALPAPLDTLQPEWHENSIIRAHNASTSTGRQAFAGPLLIVQGADDPIVSAEVTTAATRETAEMFPSASIEYHLLPGVTHDSAMYASQHLIMDWIGARFADQPPKEGYHEHVAEPLRPGLSLEKDANWFIQGKTHPWQLF